jgi:hypothetical protein
MNCSAPSPKKKAISLISSASGAILKLIGGKPMMELSYTFWEATEGGYIGFINQLPDYWTQGETREDLEKMLASLYADIKSFSEFKTAKEQTGTILVAV